MMQGARFSVGLFEPVAEMTGGKAYRQAVCDALRKKHDVEVFGLASALGIIPSVRLRRLAAMAKIKKAKDLWIRDFHPVIGMSVRRNPGKNIGLFHNMYTEGEEADLFGRCLEKIFFRNIRKCDRVVVVAEFWKHYLAELGVDNIRVIRNSIDAAPFQFGPDEEEAFLGKYGLTGSPVIYIGNCRRSKGVVEVHRALDGRGYTLVTSGDPDVVLPCPNLNLPYREYLLLLKASSVVITMSKFREGWCRTAHEAMLCKTPVIGSGLGGMAELLEDGGQFICRDLSDLPQLVEAAVTGRETLGEKGYRFAAGFTLERFEKDWLELIEEVMHDDSRSR